MAAVTKKGILAAKYGPAGDIAAVIAADTSLPSAGFQDPPPGIKNGVAQLDEVKFDTYKTGDNEGKPYFSATALIVEPFTHVYTPTSKGKETGDPIEVRTAGMQTRLMIPIHDVTAKSGKKMGQTTSWKEGAQKAAQLMRSLGADTSKVRQIGDLESLAETLTRIARNPKTPIFLRFSTSVRQAQNVGDADGAWQNWNGTAGLEDYVPPDEGAGVADASGGVDDSDPQAALGEVMAGSDETAPEGGDITTVPVDELVAAANNDDNDAVEELVRRAVEATGKTDDEVRESCGTPEEVAALIEGGGSEATVEETPEEKPAPAVKDHFNYKPMVKGIGGKMVKAKKAVECQVTAVNAAKQTVTLKNTVDGRTVYKDVAWDDLEEIQ